MGQLAKDWGYNLWDGRKEPHGSVPVDTKAASVGVKQAGDAEVERVIGFLNLIFGNTISKPDKNMRDWILL